MMVRSESKKFIIPDETSIRAQTNQDNRGNKTCNCRNGQIFESLFVFNVAKCLNWRSDLSLQTMDAGVHSFMFLEMFADFPDHPGPGDVYQYPISNLTCQTISNRRTGVYSDITMALPLKVHRYLPGDYGFCLKGMYASHVCRCVDEGRIALKVGI